jgi:Arc/MetJ-type ribon-helix-helix transcriptional regulator
MTTVTLKLPDDLQQFVSGEAQAGQFADPAAYIQALIERAKNSKAKIIAALREGLASEPIPLDDVEWERIRDEVHQRRSHG